MIVGPTLQQEELSNTNSVCIQMGLSSFIDKRMRKTAPELKGGNCRTWEVAACTGSGTKEMWAETVSNKAVSATVRPDRCQDTRQKESKTDSTDPKALRAQTSRSSLSDCCCQLQNRFSTHRDTRLPISFIAQEITCQLIISEQKG